MNSNNQQSQPVTQQPAKPTEQTGFSVEGSVKIFDPQTQKVFVEKRI